MRANGTNKIGITALLTEERHRASRHLILQGVILTISLSMFFDAPDKLNTSLNRIYGWITYCLFLNMLVYFNAYVLFKRFLAQGKWVAYMISLLVFTVFAMFVMVILQELFYDIAITHQQPSAIALSLNIASSMLAVMLFLGGVSTLLLVKQWILATRRKNALRLATFHSELRFLKNQINPHFLFNMINSATILVDQDPIMAQRILQKLDAMLSYQFNDGAKENVPLEAEIRFLTDFLDLEKVRRDYFEYRITRNGDLEQINVPAMLFIPFVENAVKHNLDTKLSYVHIDFRVEQNRLFFRCVNSKPSKPVSRDVGGLGLANSKRRLDLLFENAYILDRVETESTYTVNLQFNIKQAGI